MFLILRLAFRKLCKMRNQKSIFNQNGGELLREVPEDGHVLILFETKDELKTFGDYQNLVSCLDG